MDKTSPDDDPTCTEAESDNNCDDGILVYILRKERQYSPDNSRKHLRRLYVCICVLCAVFLLLREYALNVHTRDAQYTDGTHSCLCCIRSPGKILTETGLSCVCSVCVCVSYYTRRVRPVLCRYILQKPT